MSMDTDTAARRILVVDDEESIRFVLARGLERKGYTVDTAATLAEALELLNERAYFIMFLDIIIPDGSGFDLLETVKARPHPPAVVVMTAEATMKNAITAMQKGAFDYITKPFDFDVVDILVNRVLEYRKMSQELDRLKSGAAAPQSADDLVGRCEPMQEVFKLIGRAANTGENILIMGPTGSGKELVARALHFSSSRAHGPFITVNCAAIPNDLLESELFGHVKGAFTGAVEDRKGKFLAADGGTILLDEVGDMPLPLQAKMLRVLQDKEFYPVGSARAVRGDARVLASTNRDLEKDAAAGRFREDLYHRLNVISVRMPPLRERKPDIPLLVEHFLSKIARTLNERPKTVGPGVMDALTAYDWPGNVRELENTIRRAVIMSPGGAVTLGDLPGEFGGRAGGADPQSELAALIRRLASQAPEGEIYDRVVGAVEKALLEHALNLTGGVQLRAAKILGVNRNTMAKKMGDYGIDRPSEQI